jgi:hypothetical protein
MDTTGQSPPSEVPSERTSSLTSCARSDTSTSTPSDAARRFPLDLVESLRASRDRAAPTVFDFDAEYVEGNGWEFEESWEPDVGEGMLIEELLDESTLQWLERVKKRKAGNVKADQISGSQEESYTQT